MSRWLFFILLAACSTKPMDPFSPFQIPTWTTLPTDDQIVRAVVGVGGSAAERADAELLTRDLLLTSLRARSDLGTLQRSLDKMRRGYELEKEQQPHDAFLRFAILEAVDHVRMQASRLAAARLKHDLWPSEPFPEPWDDSAAIDPAGVASAATALAARLKDLEARYGQRLPRVFAEQAPPLDSAELGEYRALALARNHLHVALTGDHASTGGSIYNVLSARGVETRRLAADHPY